MLPSVGAIEIRDVRTADQEAVIALVLERMRFTDRGLVSGMILDEVPMRHRRLLCAVDDGQVVAAGYNARMDTWPAGSYGRSVVVDEAHVGTGLGSRLTDALDDDLPPDATEVGGRVDDSDEQALAVLDHWDYERLQHSIVSELALTATAPPTVPDGLRIEVSDSYLFEDEDAVEAMYDASQTNPERYSLGVTVLAELRAWAQGSPPGTAPMCLLRVDERPAAMAIGVVDGETAHVVYTGVDPAYRGRQLARLVKQHLHRELYDRGGRRCVTDNEEHNTGIRHVNELLGYRRTMGVYVVRKRLG